MQLTTVEAALATSPMIAVPTLVIHGGADPSASEGKEGFCRAISTGRS